MLRGAADLSSAQHPHLTGSHPFTLLLQMPSLPRGHPLLTIQLGSVDPDCPVSLSNGILLGWARIYCPKGCH